MLKRSVVLIKILFVIIPVCIANNAIADDGAGFDCGKAKSARERLICSNQELSRLDGILNKEYVEKKEILSEDERSKLLYDQRMWLKKSSEQCPVKDDNFMDKSLIDCMSRQYKKRIGDIEDLYSNADVTIVSDKDDLKKYISDLQESISEINASAKIISCDRVVLSNKNSGEDKIYGAACYVDVGAVKKINVLMCDDTMVGKFTLKNQYSWRTSSLSVISSFVVNNCPPGG
jgi:uncharacterized protein